MSPRLKLSAGLALVSLSAAISAAAAERPRPYEPSRACPRHGPGFVEVPGTGSCIRISGRVRSEVGTATRRVGRGDIAGFGTSGSVSVDSRTDTAYGPMRTFMRVRAGQGTLGPQRP